MYVWNGASQVTVYTCEAKLRAASASTSLVGSFADHSQTYIGLVPRIPTSLGTETIFGLAPKCRIMERGHVEVKRNILPFRIIMLKGRKGPGNNYRQQY